MAEIRDNLSCDHFTTFSIFVVESCVYQKFEDDIVAAPATRYGRYRRRDCFQQCALHTEEQSFFAIWCWHPRAT